MPQAFEQPGARPSPFSLAPPISSNTSDPLAVLEPLLSKFAATAVSRDQQAGTQKRERDLLRASGLLSLVILVLTVYRDGIYINDDWNAIGLRQTDSGSVRFDGVRVLSHEVLGSRSPQAIPFQSFRACLTQQGKFLLLDRSAPRDISA